MKRIAVYPGSFDPPTNGHLSVLQRAAGLFDEVVFLLAVNPEKKSRYSVEERLEMMRESASFLVPSSISWRSSWEALVRAPPNPRKEGPSSLGST